MTMMCLPLSMNRLKVKLLRFLLRWYHEEYYPVGYIRKYENDWNAIDRTLGILYKHLRDQRTKDWHKSITRPT